MASDSRANGLRQQQKRETKNRVLEAARRLFGTLGFEATTIRQIAQEAEVSTGTVMAHYNSKIALLLAIVEEVNERQLAMVKESLPSTGQVCERILHMFRVYAVFDLEHPTLAAAVFGFSWQWDMDTEKTVRQHFVAGDNMLVSIMQQGVENNEIDRNADLMLAVKMIFALYTRCLREAIFDQQPPSKMIERFKPQLDLVCKGMRPEA